MDISADTAPQRHRHRRVGEYIKDEPLSSLALAAAAGFIVGGGLNSRVSQAMITIVGRIALQSAATSLIAGIVSGSSDNLRQDRTRPGGTRHGNGKTERTNIQKPE